MISESFKVDKNSVEIFENYIKEKKAVIVDTNKSTRTGLARTLITMGMKSTHIKIAENYESAKTMIQHIKPEIVITDFELGTTSGLTLLQEQRLHYSHTQPSLFVIVTGNNSQSAIAQAAEEDVDTFILKPYTTEFFKKSMVFATLTKINPNEYHKTIELGKTELTNGNPIKALEIFKQASKLDDKPSLACFYSGQAEISNKLLNEASIHYKNGLNFNKIHYKCLVGLFDLLMEEKKYFEAYDCMKKISQYFPTNPKRLATVIRLAMVTNRVEDMEKYYQVFTQIESRSPELTQIICAGLIVCGKFYLKSKLSTRALELFRKAAISNGGNSKFLKEIISILIDFKMTLEAQKFLDRFPADERKKTDYLICEFLIQSRILDPQQSFQNGRVLISQGLSDPTLYKEMIRISIEVENPDYADELTQKLSTTKK